MSQYRLTVDAWHDLDEIGEYLTAEAGERIAIRIEDEFFATFAQLVDFPGLGHARPDLTSRPIAFFPIKPYLILYTGEDPIIILAVLHSARDVKRILRNRPL